MACSECGARRGHLGGCSRGGGGGGGGGGSKPGKQPQPGCFPHKWKKIGPVFLNRSMHVTYEECTKCKAERPGSRSISRHKSNRAGTHCTQCNSMIKF